jgi:hypothetical protein
MHLCSRGALKASVLHQNSPADTAAAAAALVSTTRKRSSSAAARDVAAAASAWNAVLLDIVPIKLCCASL